MNMTETFTNTLFSEEIESNIINSLYDTEGKEVPIQFSPFFETFQEHSSLNIAVKSITLGDWILLRRMLDKYNPYNEMFPETLGFNYTNYLSVDELNNITIPDCNAGDFVSPTETVSGHVYNVDADVTGTQLGATAYTLFFFYISTLDKYVVVTREYICM